MLSLNDAAADDFHFITHNHNLYVRMLEPAKDTWCMHEEVVAIVVTLLA